MNQTLQTTPATEAIVKHIRLDKPGSPGAIASLVAIRIGMAMRITREIDELLDLLDEHVDTPNLEELRMSMSQVRTNVDVCRDDLDIAKQHTLAAYSLLNAAGRSVTGPVSA